MGLLCTCVRRVEQLRRWSTSKLEVLEGMLPPNAVNQMPFWKIAMVVAKVRFQMKCTFPAEHYFRQAFTE